MNNEIYRKYKDVPIRILRQYQLADKFFVINDDDKDLQKLKIPYPECPDWDKIDGYGLPAKDQKFKHMEIPDRLVKLEEEIGTIEEIWDVLESDPVEYFHEIEFIKKEWYYRLNGYWCFINGKPTYFSGTFYYFLNYWTVKTGRPLYRDRDRRWYAAVEYAYKDTTCPVYEEILDDEGHLIEKVLKKDDEGFCVLEDLGYLTCMGTNHVKGRRAGETSKASSFATEFITRSHNEKVGIQSLDEPSSAMPYLDHILPAFKNLPFYFKPLYQGGTDPKSGMTFNPPADRSTKKGIVSKPKKGLNSQITFANNAKPNFYDGERLGFLYIDEPGKTETDVNERHMTLLECLKIGMDRVGFTIYTTTVEETTKGGVLNYKKVCDGSHFEQRGEDGRTATGMYNFFLPSEDGMSGFIGPYGESIIETPTSEQAAFIGKTFGAREYIKQRRKHFKDIEDFDSFSKFKRMFPQKFRDAFTPKTEDVMFNKEILEERDLELSFDKTLALINGDLEWKNGEPDTEVVFYPRTDGKGKFWSSMPTAFNKDLKNGKIKKDGIWFPTSINGISSADPVKYRKTKSKKNSMGAGAFFWERNTMIDPRDEDMDRWKSNRFILHYFSRPKNDAEFGEDMIKLAVYTQSLMYPEITVPSVWNHFEDRGYAGYLLYGIEYVNNQYVQEKTPGFNPQGKKRDLLFKKIGEYIEMHGMRERHKAFIEQCIDISSMEEMTHYDLIPAFGGCLLGVATKYRQFYDVDESQEDTVDLGDMYQLY